MPAWVLYSTVVIVLWGTVGVLQKLGTNHISSSSLLIWLQVGYLTLVPWLFHRSEYAHLSLPDLMIGVSAGLVNGLGAWCLFDSLERGAKASIAVPLSALSPMLTALLAVMFLGERLKPLQWVGSILAIVAGAMLSYETPRIE